MGSVFLSKSHYAVLVVDDDPEILALLKAPLEREGYEVVTAPDGRSALAHPALARVDLILSDVDMPGMDGYELVRRVKDDPVTAAIPFLFFSALDALDNRLKGLELGANDYITKPFNAKEVCLRVRNLLAQQSRREARHAGMLTAALDLIPLGIVLLDDHNVVTLCNRTARDILARKDGLILQHQRLCGRDTADTHRIEHMVAAARRPDEPFDPSDVRPIRLSRPSLLRDYALIALPLRVADGPLRVISVVVHDPETTHIPSPELLSDAYQFTKAEARVASLLLQGKAISEIGEALDVSRNTVCSHVKKLYMKTDTQRQNDFTRLLLRGLPQLHLG